MDSYNDIIKQELTAARDEIVLLQKTWSKYASGKTSESLEVSVESDGHGWVSAPAYFGALQEGRKGGKVPAYFPEIIKRWAVAKGLSFASEQDLERFANAVAWKIKREGTKMYRDNEHIDLITDPANNAYKRIADRISPLITAQVVQSIQLRNGQYNKTL